MHRDPKHVSKIFAIRRKGHGTTLPFALWPRKLIFKRIVYKDLLSVFFSHPFLYQCIINFPMAIESFDGKKEKRYSWWIYIIILKIEKKIGRVTATLITDFTLTKHRDADLCLGEKSHNFYQLHIASQLYVPQRRKKKIDRACLSNT